MTMDKARFIALGSRLKGVPEVLTLGVKPNFYDYTPSERNLILTSTPILFPTKNYAQFLSTMGRKIFPSLETYLFAEDKIKQTTMFYMSGIPHPRTRIYYHLHYNDILRDFDFPFIAKLPRGSAGGRGVFKIKNIRDLEAYLNNTSVAYIQEYIPHDRDVRVVLINYDPILSYWRVSAQGEFRTNVYQKGSIVFDNVPTEAILCAQKTARMCNFDDVGLDLIEHKGRWLIIEANMKYGRKGLSMKGLNLKEIIRNKLLSGNLCR
ncbi:MAG: RimK family alpha-L-glutamate ligase [Deltaproteobacteria bacterium]|nr:RimK family alpha-L-glutamate ligase [Deltaproteobacteria bacterium]